MKYRYLIDKPDYSDFASGKVLFGLPGQVATPLRLIDELFQAGLEALRADGASDPVTIYDPCSGTAYHLAALAYLHWPSIATILASDINTSALAVAQRNLSLLTPAGLDQRIAALQQASAAYGKASHENALEAAGRLKTILAASAPHIIETHVFEADAFNPAAEIERVWRHGVALVLSDLPYGHGSRWQAPWLEPGLEVSDSQLAARLLQALEPVLLPKAIICLLSSKTVNISPGRFHRLRRFSAGKRLGMILQYRG